VLIGLASSGCTGCYLGHLTVGQARLLLAREPIEDVTEDPSIPPEIRSRLELVQRVRRFASGLGLSVERRYREYADWPGDRVVTTVVATRPGEVEPRGFWFPVVGSVPYKGFFDPSRARDEAERLRGDGLDVCEVPVVAYSTLGWFDDPVTGPMLRLPDGALVETLIHELVHATVFLPGEADFNEGVASFVGEEGSVRFHAAELGDEAGRAERERVEEKRRVRAELLRLRDAVHGLYTSEAPGTVREARRTELETAARSRIAALPLSTQDPGALASTLQLNDACLALAATYASDTTCYARALAADGDDLPGFVRTLHQAADAEDARGRVLAGTGCADGAPPSPAR
jgi:predicted aminopeptidase